MLNFCPDLLREPLELHKATRELLFLVDRSGSMSGTNIHRVKVSCSQDEDTQRNLSQIVMQQDSSGGATRVNIRGDWVVQQSLSQSH